MQDICVVSVEEFQGFFIQLFVVSESNDERWGLAVPVEDVEKKDLLSISARRSLNVGGAGV